MLSIGLLLYFFALLALLALVFVVIGTLCDSHLIPSVECLIREYQIPEEVAAITLIAFGSAAPEILLNSVSVLEDNAGLSLPAIFGSGMIAFGFIPSVCILSTGLPEHPLTIKPILREVGFYGAGILLFLQVIRDSTITLLESVALLSVYVLYVLSVIFAHSHDNENNSTTEEDNSIGLDDEEGQRLGDKEVTGDEGSDSGTRVSAEPATGSNERGGNFVGGLVLPSSIQIRTDVNMFSTSDIRSQLSPPASNKSTATSASSSTPSPNIRPIALRKEGINNRKSPNSSDAQYNSHSNNNSNINATSNGNGNIVSPSTSGLLGTSTGNGSGSSSSSNTASNGSCLLATDSNGLSVMSIEINSQYNKTDKYYNTNSEEILSFSGIARILQRMLSSLFYCMCYCCSCYFCREAGVNNSNNSAINSSNSNSGNYLIAGFHSLHSIFNIVTGAIETIVSYLIPSLHSSNYLAELSASRANDHLLLVSQFEDSDETESGVDPRIESEITTSKAVVPAVHSASLCKIAIILCFCVTYIGVCASCILEICTELIAISNVDSSTVGATLLAIGSEIPDTMSSIALAKRGFYDGAMAGAIGSQVINLSIGIGFPAFLRCSLSDATYTISSDDSGSLLLLVSLVGVVVAGYVISIAPLGTILLRCVVPDHGSFTRRSAMGLFLLWLLMICSFVVLNESH